VNRQIRRLGAGMLVLYAALFVQLNVVQVLRADEYNDHPVNNRAVVRDYSRPRGQILAADGTVLARSVPVEGRIGRQREYPTGDLFGPVTGYFSFATGADGVERTYSDALSGREAAPTVGGLIDLLIEGERTADVTLTIPPAVQQTARDALGERRGSVVAVDPRDGAVLALWSFPSYDPGPLSRVDLAAASAARDEALAAPGNPLLPRSFRETFFPGSTFKVVTAGAGLETGRLGLQSPSFPVESAYVPPLTNRPIRNFGGAACGGALVDILRVSCNTAFARLGVEMGAPALVGRAEAFGFNDVPPLDLPSVARSTIADVASFEENTPVLAQTAIGQNAVRSSPLQMALVAAGVANGGSVMTPHVMEEIRDSEGDVVRRFSPSEWRRALSGPDAAAVRDAMVATVTNGTAGALQIPGVPTAGKTGTAQVGTDPPASHAWIIGFAPADAPRVAVAVVVEGQPGANEQTGGRVAAPIARAVLEAALAARP
jgi:penicillin-binding protein A